MSDRNILNVSDCEEDRTTENPAEDSSLDPQVLSPVKSKISLQSPRVTASNSHAHSSAVSFSLNEIEAVTNRGGRSGSLSEFVKRRRSTLTDASDETLVDLTIEKVLSMDIEPVLEMLDDVESDIRAWLMQPEVIMQVLEEFIKKPVFEGEPHYEYGYYKDYFICSEIIMRLYTGDEDLYESFSSESSSESNRNNTVFGCHESQDLKKWELLYTLFDQESPLDEMHLLFYSKALVRLHDGNCLEDGYVDNVLKVHLPKIIPHMYSSTVKYMLVLILQSYESVHPITAKNDAMEVIVPYLVESIRSLDISEALYQERTENVSQLFLDLLQANQADRLGSFCRREGGTVLSKYFVRDQFGTIRGFESMTHGYHNFLQYMFLEQLSGTNGLIDSIFQIAVQELKQYTQWKSDRSPSGGAATELVLLYKKLFKAVNSKDEKVEECELPKGPDSEPNLPEKGDPNDLLEDDETGECVLDSTMYSLKPISEKVELWEQVRDAVRNTAEEIASQLQYDLSSSVQIAIAKYLYAVIQLDDPIANKALHDGKLILRFLDLLERKPRFDMLMIYIAPAIAFVLRDENASRLRHCPLTEDLLDGEDKPSVLNLMLKATNEVPQLGVYVTLIHEAIMSVFENRVLSANNREVMLYCSRSGTWQRLRGSSLKSDTRGSEKGDSGSDLESPNFEGLLDRAEENADKDKVDLDRHEVKDPNKEESRRSSYSLKQVLQSPMFRHPIRFSSVMKVPANQPPRSQASVSESQQQRTFGWNSMLKRIKKSLVITPSIASKQQQPFLALTNEPFHPDRTSNTIMQSAVIVDVSKGQDISDYVHHDAGVHVVDVPITKTNTKSNALAGSVDVLTSGYMYKNKMPETGQRHVWERCYFVLDRLEGTLSYYVSEAHARDRTFVLGTTRPVSALEGIPTSVGGKQSVCGLQIITQGHGALWLLVDSVKTRSTWICEVSASISLTCPHPLRKLNGTIDSHNRRIQRQDRLCRSEIKHIVTSFYEKLFGPQLKFSTPLDVPAAFWVDEKLKLVAAHCLLSSNLPESVPYWGEFHGYQRLCDYWKLRDETIERFNGRVLRVMIDDEDQSAVVMTTVTYRILRNSQIVTEESCDIVSLCGHEIVSIHCTFDSHRIVEAFHRDGVSAS